jgi:hypothetical protein
MTGHFRHKRLFTGVFAFYGREEMNGLPFSEASLTANTNRPVLQ